MRDEFQVFILNNLAMCYKKKKEFPKAYKFIEMVHCIAHVVNLM